MLRLCGSRGKTRKIARAYAGWESKKLFFSDPEEKVLCTFSVFPWWHSNCFRLHQFAPYYEFFPREAFPCIPPPVWESPSGIPSEYISTPHFLQVLGTPLNRCCAVTYFFNTEQTFAYQMSRLYYAEKGPAINLHATNVTHPAPSLCGHLMSSWERFLLLALISLQSTNFKTLFSQVPCCSQWKASVMILGTWCSPRNLPCYVVITILWAPRNPPSYVVITRLWSPLTCRAMW